VKRFFQAGLFALFSMGMTEAAMITSLGDSALSGASVVDFTGATEDTYASLTIGNITFSGFGNTGMINLSSLFSGQYNTTGVSLSNDSGQGYGVRLVFASSISAFGFHYGGADDTFNVAAYSDTTQTTLIEQGTFGPNTSLDAPYNDGAVAGISSMSANILSVLITPNYVAPSGDWVLFDDFSIAANGSATPGPSAPEPSSLFLFALGLGALPILWLRRRAEARSPARVKNAIF
jgi:PEP-CTERM motif